MSVPSHIEQILAMTASSQNGAAVSPLQEMLLTEIARALDISKAPQTDADAVQKFAKRWRWQHDATGLTCAKRY